MRETFALTLPRSLAPSLFHCLTLFPPFRPSSKKAAAKFAAPLSLCPLHIFVVDWINKQPVKAVTQWRHAAWASLVGSGRGAGVDKVEMVVQHFGVQFSLLNCLKWTPKMSIRICCQWHDTIHNWQITFTILASYDIHAVILGCSRQELGSLEVQMSLSVFKAHFLGLRNDIL